MGLDTSHNCWHGAYSAFARFRKGLAAEIGINLDTMEGFGPSTSITLMPGYVPAMANKWEPDPVYALLNHSDCEGEIAHADCGPLAKRLREIVADIDPARAAGGHLDGIREAAITFAEGLELADNCGEDVDFH